MTGPGRNSDACRRSLLPGGHRWALMRSGSRPSGPCSFLIPCLLRLRRFLDEQDPLSDRFLFTLMFAHSDVLLFLGKNPVTSSVALVSGRASPAREVPVSMAL